MKEIVLNDKQKALLESHLNDEYNPFFASEEDQVAFNEVINMAEALMNELDAFDESGADMMQWFYDKYQEQQKAK